MLDAGLEDLPSDHDCAVGGAFDTPAAVIANTRSSVARAGGDGMKLLEFFAKMHEAAAALWSEGQPLEGGMWVKVAIGNTNPDRYACPAR
jgi:hypothetical protein